MYEIYWAKAQLQARQHRNMAKLGLALNGLWHTSNGSPSPAFDTATPLTYVDRMRMRVPGDTSFALGTHMDGGGIERWEDPSYRQVYRHIFSGQWELHDPFSLDHRDEAVNDLYETPNACSVFRTFQVCSRCGCACACFCGCASVVVSRHTHATRDGQH